MTAKIYSDAFLDAYQSHSPLRPGFAERFSVYMLLERSIIWEYFQRVGQPMWLVTSTFRKWAEPYLSL